MERLLGLREAGELYGMSHHTLLRWCRIGKLPVVKLGRRVLRVRASDLERFINQSLVPAREERR